MKASRVMTKNVHCVEPDLPIARAWSLMQGLHVRHLPVTWSGALVGMVSDRDLLLHGKLEADGELLFPAKKISEVMSAHPVTLTRNATVSQLAALMLQHRIDSIPIVDAESHLVGLVTSTDLLELLTTPEQVSDVLPFSFALRTPEETLNAA